MKVQLLERTQRNYRAWRALLGASVALAMFIMGPAAYGARSWDNGGGTQWWFNPTNWSSNILPPNNDDGTAVTDTDFGLGTDALPGGEGVVYDPSSNDPGWPPTGTFPSGFNAQTVQQIYISRAGQGGAVPTPTNKLTIKGDLTATGNVIIGRSSGQRNVATNGIIVQTGGKFLMTLGTMDLGQTETTQNGMGNGTYDYRGGTLDVSRDGGSGIRMSLGTNSLALDGTVSGAAGIGKLIVHNPADHLGYFRGFNLVFNNYAGNTDGAAHDYNPDGVTKGVSIAEFHFDNGGVRPIQVTNTLTINNGVTDPGNATIGRRSAQLGLVLDSAPLAPGGIPQNLGLIDLDWDNTVAGVTGSGDLDGDGIYNDDRVFSNAFAVDPTAVSAALYQDSIVSAVFGSTKYNWKISYTGNILYVGGTPEERLASAANTLIASVSGSGGSDIVLVGFSTESLGLAGDYNGDHKVDALDYTVWRNNFGDANETDLNNNGNGGGVDETDFTYWKTNYGSTSGPGAGGTAIPEPSSVLMAIFALAGVSGLGGRRRA